jgi:hypothetical protein
MGKKIVELLLWKKLKKYGNKNYKNPRIKVTKI